MKLIEIPSLKKGSQTLFALYQNRRTQSSKSNNSAMIIHPVLMIIRDA